MTTYYDSLAWKVLGTAQDGSKIFVAFDRDSARLLIRYPVHCTWKNIVQDLTEFLEWVWGEPENIKPGLSEGELIASFIYAE